MSKTGYLVIEHDYNSAGIYFLEDNKENGAIISVLNNVNLYEEKVLDEWMGYLDGQIALKGESPMYVHTGDPWPFNGYDIKGLYDVYIF